MLFFSPLNTTELVLLTGLTFPLQGGHVDLWIEGECGQIEIWTMQFNIKLHFTIIAA